MVRLGARGEGGAGRCGCRGLGRSVCAVCVCELQAYRAQMQGRCVRSMEGDGAVWSTGGGVEDSVCVSDWPIGARVGRGGTDVGVWGGLCVLCVSASCRHTGHRYREGVCEVLRHAYLLGGHVMP